MKINNFKSKVDALMCLDKRTLAELVVLHEIMDDKKIWCPGNEEKEYPMECSVSSNDYIKNCSVTTPPSFNNNDSITTQATSPKFDDLDYVAIYTKRISGIA